LNGDLLNIYVNNKKRNTFEYPLSRRDVKWIYNSSVR